MISSFRNLIRSVLRSILIHPTEQERHCWRDSHSIALTFDDYAEPGRVNDILDILYRERVRAGFFPVGQWVLDHQALVERMKRDGHWVGGHTFSHRRLRWARAHTITREVLAVPVGQFIRPPFGDYGRRVRRILTRLELKACYWTVDSRDWTGITAAEICDNVLNGLDRRGVVLLHLNGPNTLEALPQLITVIRNAGFVMDKLKG